MSDKNWEPLSIEEERFKIYPDQFHILENYGRSDYNKGQYLTNRGFNPSTSNDFTGIQNFSLKVMPGKNVLSDDEDDEDIKNIKEMESMEKEQIKLMRNIGLCPDVNSYVSSNKTFPCIINGKTRKQQRGPPIILDDNFFEVAQKPCENNSSTTPELNMTSMTTLSSDISSGSICSNDSSSSDVPLKNKPKSIYDILKIARLPPPKEEDENEFYNREFPTLKLAKKKNKKKVK